MIVNGDNNTHADGLEIKNCEVKVLADTFRIITLTEIHANENF